MLIIGYGLTIKAANYHFANSRGEKMKSNAYRLVLSLSAISLTMLSFGQQLPVYGQSETDSATVKADQLLNNATGQQLQQLENEKATYQLEINKTETADENFRNYAQKRVAALLKLRKAGGSPSRSLTKEKEGELYALEHWLAQDTQTKEQEQARLQQLDQAIANLQKEQNQSITDMRNDIHNMRVDADAQAADKKFQQQMAVNYFNELQSEMGAVSWGRPPGDGIYNTQSGTLNRLFRSGGGQGGYGGYAAGGYNY